MNNPILSLQKTIWSVINRRRKSLPLLGSLELGLRLGKNTFWLFIARSGTLALMLIFTLLIARRLGEEGLGEYAFLVSVLFLANILSTFGTDMWILRSVSASRNLNDLPAVLLLQLIISALAVVLIYFCAPWLPNQSGQVIRALQWYSLVLFPLAFYTVFSAALRGFERMQHVMWLNLFPAALQLGLCWLLLHPGAGLITLVWVLLGTQVATAVLAGYFCIIQIPGFRLFSLSNGAMFPSILRLLRASAPLALLGLLKVLYQRSSVYLLSTLQSAAVTGWYVAALRPVEASQIGHIALLGALFPVMARANLGRRKASDDQEKLFSYSLWLLLALGSSAAFILFLLAPEIVTLLYGDRFAPTVQPLRWLAWILVPYSLNISLSSQLLSAGEDRLVALTLLISLLVLVGLSAWWIPQRGLPGASLAALLAETIQAGLFLACRTTFFRNLAAIRS